MRVDVIFLNFNKSMDSRFLGGSFGNEKEFASCLENAAIPVVCGASTIPPKTAKNRFLTMETHGNEPRLGRRLCHYWRVGIFDDRNTRAGTPVPLGAI
jgi:hypothetical protein